MMPVPAFGFVILAQSDRRQRADGVFRHIAKLASSLRSADTENSWTANIKLTLDDSRQLNAKGPVANNV
jgi:hypothetical protein